MKVAVTHTRYAVEGNVERYVHELVRRLCDAGHEVHCYCLSWDEHADPRVHIHRVPNPWKRIPFMRVWSFDRWLSQNVRREDFDVVHGFSTSSYQDIYTVGPGGLRDGSTSLDAAGGGQLGARRRRSSLHRRQVLAIEARRFTRENFRRVVTPSDLAAEQIKRRHGLTDEEVVTAYDGIDTERFHPRNQDPLRAEHRDRLSAPSDCFMVLTIGNDYRRKGVPTLIEAAGILEERGLPNGRSFRFCVVGKERPKLEKELSQRAKERGVYERIKLYGVQDVVERWHAMADLFVLPSRSDAFGRVVLEAMASGVPTLVSSRAGAAEVVRDGETGWVLEDPGDAQAIADRVSELAADEERRRAMGRAARAEAEAYSWDRHFERVLSLSEEVAAEKQREAATA